MYKFSNGALPVNFSNYFVRLNQTHNYNTRAADSNFYLTRKYSNKGLATLKYLGAKLWLEIPQSLKDKRSLHSFIKC